MVHRGVRRTWGDVERMLLEKTAESSRLDFKREISEEKDALHDLRCDAASLANAHGGELIIGITDDKNVAGKLWRIDTAKVVDRAKSALATNIEPSLSCDVYRVTNPSDESQGVVVIVVEASSEPLCVAKAQDRPREFWIRRSDSNRPMSAADIRQKHDAAKPPATESVALSALGVWELRRQPTHFGPTFEMDPDRLPSHLEYLRSVLDRSGNSPLVSAEVASRLSDVFTDTIQRGGWLENYKQLADRLQWDLADALRAESFEGARRYVFERAVDFGHMLSYQASRRLRKPEKRMLIALGSRLLGFALACADEAGNEPATKHVEAILRDQRRYYAGDDDLLACFDFSLAGRAGVRWRDDDEAPALFLALDERSRMFIESGFGSRRGTLRRTWRVRLRWAIADIEGAARRWRFRRKFPFQRVGAAKMTPPP